MTTQKIRMVGLPLMLLLCLYTAGQIWVTEHQQANQTQALTSQRGSLATDVDTLRDQVRYCRVHPHSSYCRTPAAPPPQVRISQHPAKPVIVVGADGQAGATGKRGPGPTRQQTADAVNKYMALHPLSDGKDGTPGRDGLNGQTPPCMSLPTQCQGPAGRDGADGAPGKDGANGKDGRDGVSVVDEHVDQSTCHLIVTYSDGRTQDAGHVSCPGDSPNASPGTS